MTAINPIQLKTRWPGDITLASAITNEPPKLHARKIRLCSDEGENLHQLAGNKNETKQIVRTLGCSGRTEFPSCARFRTSAQNRSAAFYPNRLCPDTNRGRSGGFHPESIGRWLMSQSNRGRYILCYRASSAPCRLWR